MLTMIWAKEDRSISCYIIWFSCIIMICIHQWSPWYIKITIKTAYNFDYKYLYLIFVNIAYYCKQINTCISHTISVDFCGKYNISLNNIELCLLTFQAALPFFCRPCPWSHFHQFRWWLPISCLPPYRTQWRGRIWHYWWLHRPWRSPVFFHPWWHGQGNQTWLWFITWYIYIIPGCLSHPLQQYWIHCSCSTSSFLLNIKYWMNKYVQNMGIFWKSGWAGVCIRYGHIWSCIYEQKSSECIQFFFK